MRNIKFRGKRIDNGEWVEGYYFKQNNYDKDLKDVTKYYIKKFTHYDYDYENTFEVDPNTVGQYTGLHDKNGKEIYEGDIVQYEDWTMCYEGGGNDSFINRGVIEYCEENCCFNVTERQTVNIEDVLYKDNEDLEVIGNIYENKELLGEEE